MVLSSASTLDSRKIDEIVAYVEAESKRRGWRGVRALPSGSRFDGEYLKLPVKMSLRNAWEKAKRLQELEDGWNGPTRRRRPGLVIVPAEAPIDA